MILHVVVIIVDTEARRITTFHVGADILMMYFDERIYYLGKRNVIL